MKSETKLPAAQIARREELMAAEAAKNESNGEVNTPRIVRLPSVVGSDEALPAHDPVPDPVTVPAPVTVPVPPDDAVVTGLRAQLAQAQRSAELRQLEHDEALHRLTELEEAVKATRKPKAPEKVARIDPSAADLAPEDVEQYSESIPVIQKVALKQIADTVNPQLDDLHTRLTRIEDNLSNVTSIATNASENVFVDKVKGVVPHFDEITGINNRDRWNNFLSEPMPGAGMSYRDALGKAHAARKLEDVRAVFTAYIQKNPAEEKQSNDGYNGINVSGNQAGVKAPATQEKLKMSDRKKLHDDRIKNRITQDEYKAKKVKFDEADKLGLLDYNN